MNINYDLIIFSGSPGAGKSTLGELLQKELGCPLIDFGWLREFHLDREWKNANPEEEQMAFENLTFILRNYIKHGYKNVIINDLEEDKVEELLSLFKDSNYVILTIVVKNEEELIKRISERKIGFTNIKKAVSWNRKVIDRLALPNEIKVDNSGRTASEVVHEIMNSLQE